MAPKRRKRLRFARRLTDNIRRLLRALAAFGVLNDLGEEKFDLTATARVCAPSPQSVRPLVLMYGSDNSRQVFHGLEECVKSGRNGFEIAFGAANSFDYLRQTVLNSEKFSTRA